MNVERSSNEDNGRTADTPRPSSIWKLELLFRPPGGGGAARSFSWNLALLLHPPAWSSSVMVWACVIVWRRGDLRATNEALFIVPEGISQKRNRRRGWAGRGGDSMVSPTANDVTLLWSIECLETPQSLWWCHFSVCVHVCVCVLCVCEEMSPSPLSHLHLIQWGWAPESFDFWLCLLALV